jgi:hypothetical protein
MPGELTMSKATIAAGAFVTVLVLVVLVFVVRGPALEQDVESGAAASPAMAPSTAEQAEVYQGFLYGRIAAGDATYEGRLRWGREQEAFWGDFFNGRKQANPWAVHAPGGQQRSPIEIFGFEFGGPERPNLGRPFMARFGDIARIEVRFRTVHVTLKSGTAFELDRFAAGDIDDGVRVWDVRRGVVDLDVGDIRTNIRSIEFLPAAPIVAAPTRLHGTVRTPQGDFTGFIQWNEVDGVGTDQLEGRSADAEVTLRYETIRSIARRTRDSALVTLLDGREMVLSDKRETFDSGPSGRQFGPGNRGIYVDDVRYGRVMISWDAFERLEFSPGGSGPAYGDFPAGRPLTGSVTTRDGRRVTGRLVYDFDESETTETFDVSEAGVDYNIPFGLIASIVPRSGEALGRRATVTLHDGKDLDFERKDDLSERNAGVLVFVEGRERPEHVVWADVERVDLDPARHATQERISQGQKTSK